MMFTGNGLGTNTLRKGIYVLSAVAGLAIIGMIVLTVADVIGRRFGFTINGVYDIVRILGALAIGASLPLTKAVKGHIAIEYFFQKMGRTGRKWTDTLMRLLLVALFGVLTYQFMVYGLYIRESGEVSTTLHMPIFWIPWLLAFACLLTLGVTLWHLMHPGRSMMRTR